MQKLYVKKYFENFNNQIITLSYFYKAWAIINYIFVSSETIIIK